MRLLTDALFLMMFVASSLLFSAGAGVARQRYRHPKGLCADCCCHIERRACIRGWRGCKVKVDDFECAKKCASKLRGK